MSNVSTSVWREGVGSEGPGPGPGQGAAKVDLNWYTIWVISYLMPPVILLGLVGNSLTQVLLVKWPECVSRRSRQHLLFLAFCDNGFLFWFHFLRVFLYDSLYVYSGGSWYYALEIEHLSACKLLSSVAIFFGSGSGYGLAAFCLERFISIRWPLESRRYHSNSNSICNSIWNRSTLLLALITAPSTLYTTITHALGNDIVPAPHRPLGLACLATLSSRLLYLLRNIGFLLFLAHPLPILILNILLIRTLRSAADLRKLLLPGVPFALSSPGTALSVSSKPVAAGAAAASTDTNKDLLAAIIAVLITSLRIALYTPVFIFYGAYYLIPFLPEQDQAAYAQIRPTFGNIGSTFLRLASIASAANFYIYCWRIASFRHAARALLSCRNHFSFSD